MKERGEREDRGSTTKRDGNRKKRAQTEWKKGEKGKDEKRRKGRKGERRKGKDKE